MHAMRGELAGVAPRHKCALGEVRERLRRGRVFHVSLREHPLLGLRVQARHAHECGYEYKAR